MYKLIYFTSRSCTVFAYVWRPCFFLIRLFSNRIFCVSLCYTRDQEQKKLFFQCWTLQINVDISIEYVCKILRRFELRLHVRLCGVSTNFESITYTPSFYFINGVTDKNQPSTIVQTYVWKTQTYLHMSRNEVWFSLK